MEMTARIKNRAFSGRVSIGGSSNGRTFGELSRAGETESVGTVEQLPSRGSTIGRAKNSARPGYSRRLGIDRAGFEPRRSGRQQLKFASNPAFLFASSHMRYTPHSSKPARTDEGANHTPSAPSFSPYRLSTRGEAALHGAITIAPSIVAESRAHLPPGRNRPPGKSVRQDLC